MNTKYFIYILFVLTCIEACNSPANQSPVIIADTTHTGFLQQVPGTTVSFTMIAIPGGVFAMGSPEHESFHRTTESPVREVSVSSFFMGETEVTWDEFLEFYYATKSEGRMDPRIAIERNLNPVDGISGPTPLFGQRDYGWGYGKSPVVAISHYAAQVYCQWLSLKTGKKYRLPTEAEWEYAARGGTQTPYFFKGDPKKYSQTAWWDTLFGKDTTMNTYVVYKHNSGGRPHTAERVMPNPFGVKNMLGNVMEYCSDWYAEDAYAQTGNRVSNPQGPEQGEEHVVRGGSFYSEANDVRCASRDYTRNEAWQATNPQSPKSIWWLTDCNQVGFRVVCEVE